MSTENNYPKIEDGCVISSWKCQNPSRDEMKEDSEQKKRCKGCPVCHMVLCKYHMSEQTHMQDCNFRSNQERELLEKQRVEQEREKAERRKKESEEAKEKSEFEEKEKIRKANIEKHNVQAQGG